MARFNEKKKPGGASKGKAVERRPPVAPKGFQISHPQCKVCQSPSRRFIDRLLVLGIPAAQVAAQYSDIDEIEYSRKSMANHKNKHLDLRDAAIRRMVEKRAEEAGIDVEAATESLLTSRSALETLVHKGYESVVTGEVLVRPEDMMSALKHLREEEEEIFQVQLDRMREDLREELNALIRAIQKVVPSGMHNDVMVEFKRGMEEIKKRREVAQIGQPNNR